MLAATCNLFAIFVSEVVTCSAIFVFSVLCCHVVVVVFRSNDIVLVVGYSFL